MKKIIFILMALLFLASPVLADTCPGNEVLNGDFSTKNLSYWTGNYNIGANGPPASATDWWAQKTLTAEMYQVFVEPDWVKEGFAKEWEASFKLAVGYVTNPGTGSGSISLNFYYYDPTDENYWQGTTGPTFTPNNGGAKWTQFYGDTLSTPSAISEFPKWVSFAGEGELDVQPRWLAVEVISTGTLKTAVDDVCFQGTCVVPLPGAVLLLGAGLARLAAYARRRRQD